MTSRERVRAAINHREPDRVPLDIGGSKVTGICVDEYVALAYHLGLYDGPPKVYEPFGMLARVEEPVRRRLRCDVIELENPTEAWGLYNRDWKEWTTGPGNKVLMPGQFNPETDENGYLYINDAKGEHLACMPKHGLYFERWCETGMQNEVKYMDPEKWRQAIPLYSDADLADIAKRAAWLFNNTDYSIHGGFLKGALGSNGIFAGQTVCDWYSLLLTDEDYAYSILQATAERAVENLKLYLQAAGKYIDTIIVSGTDFGSQKSEIINPEIFRKLYVPNYKKMNDYVHANCAAKTFFHCCGSCRNLIESFIAAGVDILNPVQTSAAGMEPARLKREFGDRIVFWGGGADTQHILPHGTVEEVREHVRERIGILASGSGFVFAAIHDLQYGVPPENLVAMADAVHDYGNYPSPQWTT